MSDKEFKPTNGDSSKQHFANAALEELARAGLRDDEAFLSNMDSMLDEIDSREDIVPVQGKRSRSPFLTVAVAAVIILCMIPILHFVQSDIGSENAVELADVDLNKNEITEALIYEDFFPEDFSHEPKPDSTPTSTKLFPEEGKPVERTDAKTFFADKDAAYSPPTNPEDSVSVGYSTDYLFRGTRLKRELVEKETPATSYFDEKDFVQVENKPTGTLRFGAGFSSIDSVSGFIEVTDANFDLSSPPSSYGDESDSMSVTAGDKIQLHTGLVDATGHFGAGGVDTVRGLGKSIDGIVTFDDRDSLYLQRNRKNGSLFNFPQLVAIEPEKTRLYAREDGKHKKSSIHLPLPPVSGSAEPGRMPTLKPYIGYNGTPDTWLADSTGISANTNDVVSRGVSPGLGITDEIDFTSYETLDLASAGDIRAVVKGEVITQQDLENSVRTKVQMYLLENRLKVSEIQAKKAIQEIEKNGLTGLIDQKLILKEFKALGGAIQQKHIDQSIDRLVTEQFSGDRTKFLDHLKNQGLSLADYEKHQRDSIAIQALKARQISSAFAPAEKRKMYDAIKNEYASEGKVKLRMISIPKAASDNDASAQKQLVSEIREKIKAGESFDELAKQHSADSFSTKGGLIGEVDRNTLNGKLTDIAFDLAPKQVSEVVDDGGNWRLLYVEGKTSRKLPPQKELESEIEQRLSIANHQKNMDAWLNGLRSKAKIQIAKPEPQPTPENEKYGKLVDNPFRSPLRDPLSTFSVDVDTASYTNIRRMVKSNTAVPADSVRIEEMINYFSYNYPQPEGERPFVFAVETADCPWNGEHQLMRVGIQGKSMNREKRPEANLVFLLDVSGSMSPQNKLPLVQKSMSLVIEELTEKDTVSIVVYAGAEGLCLPPTPGDQKQKILDSLNKLKSGGSTNGGAGIQLAYKLAKQNYKPNGINRVILCTDGDFNVGRTDEGGLVDMVEKKAKDGTFLSVLGFGSGNINDSMLEAITNKGNGNYFYIDSLNEGRKVLLQDLMSTLVTIAKDVKIQIEFNPKHVQNYRLIGYANRMLKAEDFENDKVDAGEIGAGHSVTALYEIVPAGAPPIERKMSNLRYQQPVEPEQPKMKLVESDELCTLKLRYKLPDSDKSTPMEQAVKYKSREWKEAGDDFQFSAAVALWGMLLRNSEHSSEGTVEDILEMAKEGRGEDPFGRRDEFIRLVKQWNGAKGFSSDSMNANDVFHGGVSLEVEF